MKKRLIVLLCCVVIAVAFVMSGCAASLMLPYEYGEGVTVIYGREGDDYVARFDIAVADVKDKSSEMYDYFYSKLGDAYGDKLLAPSVDDVYDMGNNAVLLTYYVVQDQSFFDEPKIDESRRVFFGTYNMEYNNPLRDGAFSNFYYDVNENFEATFGSSFGNNVTVLLPAGRKYSVEGGTVAAFEFAYYARWNASFDALPDTFKMSTSFMISYAWYLTAVVIGVLVLVLILLIAKKKDGQTVPYSPTPKRAYYSNNPNQGSNPNQGNASNASPKDIFGRDYEVPAEKPQGTENKDKDDIFPGF